MLYSVPMAFPPYIVTRNVSVGGSMGIESSELLKVRVEITASKSLVWEATGYHFVSYGYMIESELGTEVVAALPATDVAGWRDPALNALIDVSAPDSYTHLYTARVSFIDAVGAVRGIVTLGPFALPAEDGSVVDLDKMLPVGSVAGGSVSIPDYWGTLVADAEAAASAAQAAVVDSAAFVNSTIETGLTPEAAQAIADTPELANTIAVGAAAAVAPVAADVEYNRGVRRGSSTIFLGDSVTRNLNTLTDQNQPLFGEGFATLVGLMSNQRITLARNSGVSNDTVQDAVARIQADVIAYHPARCVILLGTNNTNIASPTIEATLAAYETGIIQPLLMDGIEPVIVLPPPRSGVRTSEPATYRRQAQYLTGLRAIANRFRILVVDGYAAMTDPTTGDYKTGYSPADGVHPGKVGMKALAQAIIDGLTATLPSKGVPLALDRFDPVNLAPDPLMLGGLNGSGNVMPTGWSGSTTGFSGTIVDPVGGDGLEAGKWFKIIKTDNATTKNINWIKTFSALATAGNPVVVGDRIAWAFRYKLSGSEGVNLSKYVTVALRYTDSGGVNKKIVTPMNQFEMDSEGVCYFEATVPGDADRIRFDLSFSTASLQTLMIGQISVYNLTNLGIPSLLGTAQP